MQSLTISLPDDVQLALDEYVRKEGVSRDDVVSRAVEEHLCRQELRSSQKDSSAALEAGYREMAADEAHELEAHQWARLSNHVGRIAPSDMLEVERAIKTQLGLRDEP